MKSAVVLGAGMVGVATALQLQRRGWSVTLVDRKEPGRETSYGNAGLLQSEALRPAPMPRAWHDLMRIAMGRSNSVRYQPMALPQNCASLLRYWWHSSPKRHERISAAYAAIIRRAAHQHQNLISDSGADHLVRRFGYRVLHRDQAAFETDIAKAEAFARAFGVKFAVLTPRDLKQAEPGLIDGGLGALHWLEPWTVSDPGALVTSYANLFKRLGGQIVRGEARTLTETRAGWSIAVEDGRIEVEAAVVALGPWSPAFLKRFGYRIPMVRKRGYHRHYVGGSTLDLPLVDISFGYTLAPMTKGLRINTGAEITAPDAKPTQIQLSVAEQAARRLMDLGQPVEAEPWHGTRPCMPDMLPVVGRASRHRSLWLHFGHGHQGFTLGPVTGRLIAELMNDEPPIVDPFPYRCDRL